MTIRSRLAVAFCGLLLAFVSSPAHAEPPPEKLPSTGPATEKRFPPLTVPAGFKATLFACDPLVEYPSVIALGPKPGSLLVAYDYMTGLGVEITRRDEVRLVQDTDGDGYADASTLIAGGFNSIQGLAAHDGAIYVMHAPLLTLLRDANGDGKIEGPDERRDLFDGLGLPPEKNSSRLHCANGVVAGHDGWLYLAMGDNGTDVARPEGDRLVFHAGGILRCRPDGKDLHVFSSGLRNIYDVALDEELNVFVRDNENDGGDYMIRVCQSFPGADHGYPYHYYERPDEALKPLADLGRGSSAGIACYLETAFPSEYRGNLFCCEWGRSVVRYERKRAGSSFAPMKEIEFAAGAENDPYGFKPTDVVVDRDGSLLVSDWGDGQRPKRGRGRIYRISYTGAGATASAEPPPPSGEDETARLIRLLDAPGAQARNEAVLALLRRHHVGRVREAISRKTLGPVGRLHAVWVLARGGGAAVAPDLFRIAESDPEPGVRAQAVRTLADLADPRFGPPPPKEEGAAVLAQAGEKLLVPADVAKQLAALGPKQDPRVALEIVIAFGRLRWPGAPEWLRDHLSEPDAALSHAAQQALGRCDNLPGVLALLDESDEKPLRAIALRSLAERHEEEIVEHLAGRFESDKNPVHRAQYAELLARVHKQPAAWTYWGYRPAPRPANSVAWKMTDAIAHELNARLWDDNLAVRTAALKGMLREQIPVKTVSLAAWLKDERESGRVRLMLDALAKLPAAESREPLFDLLRERDHAHENRQRALALLIAGIDAASEPILLKLADQVEDGPLQGELLAAVSRRPGLDARPLAVRKLDSPDPAVKAAALRACVERKVAGIVPRLPAFLQDRDPRVRRAACAAAGALAATDSVEPLLGLAREPNPEVRAASLAALRALEEPRAADAAVPALKHPATQLAALDCLAAFGRLEHRDAVAALAATSRSVDVLTGVVRALAHIEQVAATEEQAAIADQIAGIQGRTGLLLRWHAAGPLTPEAADALLADANADALIRSASLSRIADAADSRLALKAEIAGDPPVRLAESRLVFDEPVRAQFLASSSGTLEIRVNGRVVHKREKPGAFQADSDRFEADLVKGLNRIAVRTDAVQGAAEFHVRFRPLSSSAEHERITQFALQNAGSADRGRELFLNSEKTLCMKCHRIDESGGNIGPSLTGVGSRFSRIHLLESILEPSRTIAPSYETVSVALVSGQVLIGVKVAEDEATLSLGDETGKRHDIAKKDIEERTVQRQSTMPKGIEKRVTDRELLDLLTYLLAQKKRAE